jgi:diadenosine tetraphosphate (Ap4A) HIT family hydrolase
VVSEHAIAFPDAFPVTQGHTLVVPRVHVESVFDLPQAVQTDLWILVARVRSQLAGDADVDGFTVGTNDGVAAGQTVPHAHIHVIPRRRGDVPDPRGGVRWVIPDRAAYWSR